MEYEVPPDHYAVLGVSRTDDTETIKKAYRKLALKLHPDKCVDESQKAKRTDEFTRVQQAWDVLQDSEKRQYYDGQCRLHKLRQENAALHRKGMGGRTELRPGSYNTRTAVPKDTSYAPSGYRYEPSFASARPRYYEESSYESMRSSARKVPVAEDFAYVRTRDRSRERERPRVKVEVREATKRADASRATKFDNVSRDDFEKERQRRDAYEEMRRRTQTRSREREEEVYTASMEEQMSKAHRHIKSTLRPVRPSMTRRESTMKVPLYDEVRRASPPTRERERPRETRRSSSSKDDRHEPRRPTVQTYTSAPSSESTKTKKKSSRESSPPPMARSTTMPAEGSKRKDSAGKTHAADSGYSSSSNTPAGRSYSPKYTFVDDGSSTSTAKATYASSEAERTTVRDAGKKSPSPSGETSRPSNTAKKMADLAPEPKPVRRTTYAYPAADARTAEPVSTSKPAANTSRRRERESEREYRFAESMRPSAHYFGEHGHGTIDHDFPRATPYHEGGISYAPRYDTSDVKYASGYSTRRTADSRRDYTKPGIARFSTMPVY